MIKTRRPNVNKMDSWLVTVLIGEMKTVNLGTRVRWCNNLARWHHTNNILNLDIWKLANFGKVVCFQLEVVVGRRSGRRLSFFVSVHRPLQISLSCFRMQSEHRTVGRNNKATISYSVNFVPTNHPDRQKFRVDYVIPHLRIFQTQHRHREDW